MYSNTVLTLYKQGMTMEISELRSSLTALEARVAEIRDWL